MPAAEETAMPAGEDRPIVVGGGPHHINVQIPDPTATCPKSFSLAPKDPAKPFQTITIRDQSSEIFTWLLTEEWTLTIE